MEDRLKPGDYIRNFKRELVESQGTTYIYQIVDVVYHSETQEKMIAYRAMYEPFEMWVRPYEMFMSEVDHQKYPDIKQVYRFEKLDECTAKDMLARKVSEKKQRVDFQDLEQIVAFLRSENGCPWDRKQTFESMKICLKNESEEVFQAVDNQDMDNLCEELGDVLLQVMMNAQIAKESETFIIEDVITGVSRKLIRRHPHVFGEDAGAISPEEALVKWQEVKKLEKSGELK